MRKFIYSSFLTLLLLGASAQITQLARQEIELKEGGFGESAIIGDKGFIIYGEAGKAKDRGFEVRFFNNELVEQDKIHFPIPKKFTMSGFCMREDNKAAYFLFVKKNGKFQLNTVQMESGNVSVLHGTLPKRLEVKEMTILNETIFINAMIRNKYALLSINTFNGRQNMISIPVMEKRWRIKNISPYPEQNLLAVSVHYIDRSRNIKGARMQVFFFDENGQKSMRSVEIENEKEKNPIDAKIYWIDNNHFILSGSYSTDKDFRANGLYMAEFKDGNQHFIRYHNFADMENFLDYLSDRRKKREEKRIRRKKAKGKTNSVEVVMELHPIMNFNDQYVLIGEAYFPTYRTYTTTNFVNGQTQMVTHTVFDGYEYTHAVILGMNTDGNKLWDHCFELNLNTKPYNVITNVNARMSAEDIRLFYPARNKLHSMTIDTENKRQEKNMGDIQAESPDEKVKWSAAVSSEHWYDNYFIVHGKQRIKGEDGRRTVFFVSKIAVDL